MLVKAGMALLALWALGLYVLPHGRHFHIVIVFAEIGRVLDKVLIFIVRIVGDDIILIDAGDGAVGQLARAGFRLDRVRALFLSHLHLDHAAGLSGVIGLRWMNGMQGTFRVYGPPGTRAMVDGIIEMTDEPPPHVAGAAHPRPQDAGRRPAGGARSWGRGARQSQGTSFPPAA